MEAGRSPHLRRRLPAPAGRLVGRALARRRAVSRQAAALLPGCRGVRPHLLGAPAPARRGASFDRVVDGAGALFHRRGRARAERRAQRAAGGAAASRLLRAGRSIAPARRRRGDAGGPRDGVLRLRARPEAARRGRHLHRHGRGHRVSRHRDSRSGDRLRPCPHPAGVRAGVALPELRERAWHRRCHRSALARDLASPAQPSFPGALRDVAVGLATERLRRRDLGHHEKCRLLPEDTAVVRLPRVAARPVGVVAHAAPEGMGGAARRPAARRDSSLRWRC